MSGHHSDTFESAGGMRIFEQGWAVDHPRAVVAIVHGYAEHSGRYEHVARFLNERGYSVEALDLRGHGQSEGPRALVGSMNEYLNDVGRFLRRVEQRNPAVPLFLLGHSMGGGIVTLFVITRGRNLAGLIVSGPAVGVGRTPGHFQRLFVNVMAKVNPTYGLLQLPADAISRDPGVVAAYEADPLVYRGKMQAGLVAAMSRASARIQRDMEQVTLPLLILQGTEDRLTPRDGAELLYARAMSQDKMLKLYDGLYHEVMNEPEQQRVLEDLAGWLDAHTRQPEAQP